MVTSAGYAAFSQLFKNTSFDNSSTDNGSSPPENNPPHVDEDVTFDFNDGEVSVAADSVRVVLTKIKAGPNHDPLDLAINLSITLVGDQSPSFVRSYDFLSDAPTVFHKLGDKVVEIDFSALGFAATDLIDSFVIGAREDPADPERETDEHFLIHGFSADVAPAADNAAAVPEPSSIALLITGGLCLVGYRRRRKQTA